MELTEQEKQRLEEIYQKYLHDEKIMKMQEIPMHRGSNCYMHSFKVAKLAMKWALRQKNINLEAVLIASILHDYYLYDWRKDKKLLKHHGKLHPSIANQNAKRDFGIDEEESDIILSHMWPINIKVFPKSKEAKIVNQADTHVAFLEALTSKRYKEKHQVKYLTFINKLFN